MPLSLVKEKALRDIQTLARLQKIAASLYEDHFELSLTLSCAIASLSKECPDFKRAAKFISKATAIINSLDLH